MHWLGAAVADFGRRDLREGPDSDDYSPQRVRPLDDDFDHFMRRSFGAMRPVAAGSPIAGAQFLHCLQSATAGVRLESRLKRIAGEGALLIEQARHALSGPSIEELERRYCAFDEAMKKARA